MERLSFFKLPIIASLIYFLISLLLYFLFTALYFLNQLPYNFIGFIFSEIGRILINIFNHLFLETLWLFGLLSLMFHTANIYMVNKTNIRWLTLAMAILSFIAYFIRISIKFNFIGSGMLFETINNLFWAMISLLFYSLSIYYLIKFFAKYMVKNQSSFKLTTTNSVQIHFVLFAVFVSYLLLLGYNLIINSIGQVYIIGAEQYRHLYLLNYFFILSILLGIFLAKRNFLCAFEKIQYVKLLKSVLIASGIMLICLFIDYYFVLYYMNKQYIDSYSVLLNSAYLIFLLLLQPLLSCLVLNIVTRGYFMRQNSI